MNALRFVRWVGFSFGAPERGHPLSIFDEKRRRTITTAIQRVVAVETGNLVHTRNHSYLVKHDGNTFLLGDEPDLVTASGRLQSGCQ